MIILLQIDSLHLMLTEAREHTHAFTVDFNEHTFHSVNEKNKTTAENLFDSNLF